jgi:hypothetical protein
MYVTSLITMAMLQENMSKRTYGTYHMFIRATNISPRFISTV